jgi:hypothetical protein
VGYPAGLHGAAQPAAGAAAHLLRVRQRLRDAAGELPPGSRVLLCTWAQWTPVFIRSAVPLTVECCRQWSGDRTDVHH